MTTWEEILGLHQRTVGSIRQRAEQMPAEKWTRPLAEGRWSPAEVLEHLTLVYDVLLRELAGGPGMQIRTKWWQRVLLRFTLIPRLRRGGAFPAGARAPRETRPELRTGDRTEALMIFSEKAARFESMAAGAVASGGRIRLTHAYFGRASVAESTLLCVRHLQHHERQLEGV